MEKRSDVGQAVWMALVAIYPEKISNAELTARLNDSELTMRRIVGATNSLVRAGDATSLVTYVIGKGGNNEEKKVLVLTQQGVQKAKEEGLFINA